jgi:amidohydrolase
MHACGHDGHASILLTLALILAKEKLSKSVLLIFQPGEENPGGARPIVESGVLERFKVENIFALHLAPEIEENKVGLVSGGMLAAVDGFNIRIKGLSSHGCFPQKGINAITISAQLINQIGSIANELDPLKEALINISYISGGSNNSIICDNVELKGTIRYFDEEIRRDIVNKLINICKGLEISYSSTINLNITRLYPAVINDKNIYDLVKKSLNLNDYTEGIKAMYSEDFSFYLKKVNGLFVNLGVKNPRFEYHPLHNTKFNFDEKSLIYGVKYFYHILNIYEAIVSNQ